MVDKTNGIGPLNQQFSSKGVRLAALKKDNELLFNYFKQAGFDENSMIYSTDIEKLKKEFDKNENGLSVKEARAMGLEGSRKEIKNAIKTLDTIASSELKDDSTYPVKVSENEKHFYTKDNKIKYAQVITDEGVLTEEYHKNGNLAEKSQHKYDAKGNAYRAVFEKYNEEGQVLTGEYIDENGVKAERKFDYFNGHKNSMTETRGQNETFIKYENFNGKEQPVRVVDTFKGDPDSAKVTEYEYSNGAALKQTVTYEGKMIKNDVTKEETEFSPEGKALKTTEFHSNGTKVINDLEKGIKETVIPQEIVAEGLTDIEEEKPVEKTPKKATGKLQLPEGWTRVPSSFRHGSKIMEAKDAASAVDALLNARGIDSAKVDKDKLISDVAKFNPSVFDKEGKVKNNAKWDKLDLPGDISKTYKAGAKKTPKAGEQPKADETPHVFYDDKGNPKVKVTKLTGENVRDVLAEFNKATGNNKSLPSAIIFDKDVSDEDKVRALKMIKDAIDASNKNRDWVKPGDYRYTVPNGTAEDKFRGASMYEYVFGKGSSGMLNIPDKYKFDPDAQKRLDELQEKFGKPPVYPAPQLPEPEQEEVQVPLMTEKMQKEADAQRADNKAKAEAQAEVERKAADFEKRLKGSFTQEPEHEEVQIPLRPKNETEVKAKPKTETPADKARTELQKTIPELAGQVAVTQNNDGKILYKPITGVLAGREYDSVDALRAALDLAKQGIAFPKNE